MADEGVLLAGEHSGHFFSAEDYYGTSDALLAAARLVGMVSRSSQPLSQLLGETPVRYSSRLIELPVPEGDKQRLVELTADSLSRENRTTTIDRVRVKLDDGWAQVRASNTGARLTLRFETDTSERLRDIQSMVIAHLSAAEAQLNPAASTF